MEYSKEDGVVIGNVDDKYGSRNPVARMLMDGFLAAFDELVGMCGASEVFEIGCGEGHLAARMARKGMRVRAGDFSTAIIAEARARNGGSGAHFCVKSIYDLTPEDAAPLIVCCEVLEHLEEPDEALAALARAASQWCLLSVPREPLWRVLNMARGKYLGDLGNTPGHVQHWGRGGFLRLLARHFDVVAVRSPLPWSMALCRAQ
ncbi:methyltransferase type 11 [Desulfovibrio sp. X2]|uniref:class I SAM-dependent methyltransferase n=1 Tax=Desulfovibrio sp. X2 TaxID=941449 RepID=UPI000358F098|nr:class I SAM-dependent methyltransferase [Desulfovibrio sp. X2]EPR42104.1 methyltransferase type 11 [Desulfovibrio sp. X2]